MGGFEGHVAVTFAGSASISAPILAVFITEGVAALDAVQVEVRPGKGSVLVEWSISECHQGSRTAKGESLLISRHSAESARRVPFLQAWAYMPA